MGQSKESNIEKEFAVGYFPEEDIFNEFPVIWLTPTKTHCWWPRTMNVTKYIERRDLPNASWKLCPVEIDSYSCKFVPFFNHFD